MPLFLACREGIRFASDAKGKTLLFLACRKGSRDAEEEIPLFPACREGSRDAPDTKDETLLFLPAGRCRDALDAKDETPLLLACRESSRDAQDAEDEMPLSLVGLAGRKDWPGGRTGPSEEPQEGCPYTWKDLEVKEHHGPGELTGTHGRTWRYRSTEALESDKASGSSRRARRKS